MERLLNVKEAAALLNISATTIRRWTNTGALNCYRVGGKRERRFRIQDLHECLNKWSEQTAPSSGRVKLGFGNLEVPDGSHLTHLCRSAPEALEVGISYLLQGLAGEETVLLVAPGGRMPEFVNILETRGVDVEKAQSRQKLFLHQGMDTPLAMAAFISQIISAAKGRFRLFGEMTWVMDKGWPLETIRQLEEMGNSSALAIPGRLLLCQYSLAHFSGQATMMAAETHSHTLYKETLRESPYFSV